MLPGHACPGPADLYEGLNKELGEYGEQVFCAVNISELFYPADVEYGGVPLAANETYYPAAFYDRAVCSQYASLCQNEEQHTLLTGFRCDEGGPVRRCICHQEGEGWAGQEPAE